MEAHDKAVAAVAARVREFSDRQQPFRIYHGSTNTTRRSDRTVDNTVDTSGLDHVLSVDAVAKVAVVEPNVPMDALVAATLKAGGGSGLVPLVVMEFPGITTGGGFSGTSAESSSFRHGVFETTINWIEIVLPTGEVTRASRTEKPDLFWGAASAFGTLGVVTLLEVRLRDAKPFVELTYHLSRTVADGVAKIQEEMARDANDYIEGIIFSPDATITCTGRLVDAVAEGGVPLRFTRRGDPWFYLHVEQDVVPRLRQASKTSSSPSPSPDSGDTKAVTVKNYVPLVDYLFRYDRGGFWTARWAFDYFHVPFNRLTRYLLDRFMYTRVMWHAGHKSGLLDLYLTQDVSVPFPNAADLAGWVDANLGLYPLWLCPLLIRRDDPDSSHGLHARFASADGPEHIINFGIWGPVAGSGSSSGSSSGSASGGSGPAARRQCASRNRALEAKVAELGGLQCLYAQAFHTEEEFWARGYDRGSYEELRRRYGAGYLPSVYDKVRVDLDAEEAAASATWGARLRTFLARLPLARGLWGVYKLLMGGDYLLQGQKPRKLKES